MTNNDDIDLEQRIAALEDYMRVVQDKLLRLEQMTESKMLALRVSYEGMGQCLKSIDEHHSTSSEEVAPYFAREK